MVRNLSPYYVSNTSISFKKLLLVGMQNQQLRKSRQTIICNMLPVVHLY